MSPSPTRITTAEELDALPPGTVIRDDKGTGYAVNSSAGAWGAAGTGGLWDSSTILLVMHAPFTVLHDPAAPPVSDTAAATITREGLRYAMLRNWWATQTGTEAEPWDDLPSEEQENVAENGYMDVYLDALTWHLAALGLTVTDKADQ